MVKLFRKPAMSAVLISTKGQIVLPVAAGKALGLTPGMRVYVKVNGKSAQITPAPKLRVRSQYCSVMVNCKLDADDWDLAVAGPCIEGCSRLAPVWAMSGHDKHRASCAA